MTDSPPYNSDKNKYNKSFYDVKITVEGAGEAESVASANKSVSNDLPGENTLIDNSSSSSSPSGSNTTSNIIIGVIALIFLGGIGVVVFFVMKKKNSGTVSDPISFSQGMPQNNPAPVAPRSDAFVNSAVPPVSNVGVKFCTKCGTKNSPDKVFCINCGEKL